MQGVSGSYFLFSYSNTNEHPTGVSFVNEHCVFKLICLSV